MNKVPKRIWVEVDPSGQLFAGYTDYRSGNKYIRADLVAGLVEALGDLIKGGESMGWESAIKVIVALKALEEE